MSKIAALQRVSPRTAAYHKNKIMEKYSLNNNHDFFQFMNLLRERWEANSEQKRIRYSRSDIVWNPKIAAGC